MGLDPAIIDRVFEPLFTIKPDGMRIIEAQQRGAPALAARSRAARH
jgi:hypothetical protein